MSFKDKYNQYKERKEAQNYFRSNNDMFLNSSQWIKTIGGGVLSALAAGIILGVVISALHITSSLFYLICGFVIALAVTKVSGIHSQQVALVSVGCTLLCFIIGEMTMTYLPLYEMGVGLENLNLIELFITSFKNLIVGNLFTTIIAILGLFIAYQQAQ